MSRRAHILGAAPAPRSSQDATPATHYHRALREELQEVVEAARVKPRNDWRGFGLAVLGMISLGALVLGGIALAHLIDLRTLLPGKQVEVESETERAWRIADRLRRPEDTTPPPEPPTLQLTEERALAESESEAVPEDEVSPN